MGNREDKDRIRKAIELSKKEITRVKNKNLLRKYCEAEENESKVERVRYNEERRELEKSESIREAEEVIELIKRVVVEEGEEEVRAEMIEIMKDNYYYLGRYLFSYYLVAIEFGIEVGKQFLGPRTSVLMPIARKLERFYYKKRGVMTLSMPQGTRENRAK